MFEIFLILLGLIWIIFAVFQDIKHKEIANWLNFSLIIFALGFRFFYGLFSDSGFGLFYQGLIGLGIFFVLGNLFYHGKMFAGGDAKLMIALGAVLPFSQIFSINLKIFFWFLFLFLIVAAVYSLSFSFYLGLKNFKKFKKEFLKIFNKRKNLIYVSMIIGILLMISGLFVFEMKSLILFFGIIVFIMPYFYVYAKAVDESSMIKNISTKKLKEGDWLYHDVKVGKKTIKANWSGLTKKEVSLLKKKRKKVKIRNGIAFSPVFLISFILLILFYNWINLWNTFL